MRHTSVQEPTDESGRSALPKSFVYSLLSGVGVMLSTLLAWRTFHTPTLSSLPAIWAVLSALLLLAVSLAIGGLIHARAWRLAGRRSVMNTLSVALASFSILAVVITYALAACGLYLILRVVSEI